MNPKYYSLAVVLAFAAISIPLAQAAESPELDTSLVGNSVVDLNWEDKDRLVRVYATFTNFDSNDGYFTMNVVNADSGKTVADSVIQVATTATGSVNFNSFVSYMVNSQDICADELTYDANGEVEECMNVMTGDYELQVTNRDGTVAQTETFSIIDNREA